MKDPVPQTQFSRADLVDFLLLGWLISLPTGEVLLGWGPQVWSKEKAAHGPSVFAPDFYLRNEKPWLTTEKWTVLRRSDLGGILDAAAKEAKIAKDMSQDSKATSGQITSWSSREAKAPGVEWAWQEPGLEEFAGVFGELQSEIESGRINKAVPVVFARTQGAPALQRRLQILQALARAPHSLHLYGFWTDDEGLMGATPETLFMAPRSTELHTMALAGTLPLPADEDRLKAFLSDPKERHEHQLVVDDLREVLAQWGEVHIGEAGVLRLPHLVHLQTLIQVRLTRALDFGRLAEDLHPTPALGVAPRGPGLPWMATWDRSQFRGRFGAPFGVWYPRGDWSSEAVPAPSRNDFTKESTGDAGDRHGAHCVVAIRGIQWYDGVTYLGSGCGVVRQSLLEREWRELALKRESVRRLLDLG